MAQTVIGVFDTHAQAVHGVGELRHEGFAATEISILAPDPRETEGFSDELGISVIHASATGAAAGGLLGGIAGWVIGLTGLVIPGAGIVLAAGPVAGALVGLIGGASVGGFAGMLAGLGLPHHAAQEYDRELKAGRTLVVVHAGERPHAAESALYRAHPLGLHHYEEALPAGAAPRTVAAGAKDVAAPDHQVAINPTGHVEPAAPDGTRNPGDVAVALEGQQVMGHTQYLDEADLRPKSGTQDT